MENNTATPLTAHRARVARRTAEMKSRYFQNLASVRTAPVLVHTTETGETVESHFHQNDPGHDEA